MTAPAAPAWSTARWFNTAQRVASLFADAPVTVVGLHTVFEHHEVMGPAALEVFVHRPRVRGGSE
jgi:hypothetical protein